ncbi:conserved membrane hypothetical protein [Candidatus Desulfarcum epimagneticum]|uniref:Nucleoside recognition protein n=1 Tax=uncultured Desulfobacteraceae bacterium TaxID=218296 RepID=A0A484HGI7_9BACT|nr:conserved membrane hypothetical protein [uncultured Desulfobacteraceae bacterium]
MDILLLSLERSLSLTFRMGSVMFVSLFGIEMLMQMGMMKYLKPIGAPVARVAGLPAEAAVSFLTAVGSMIAAHAMSAQFRDDGKLSDRQVILSGVLNTVPFHFREILTYQLPVALPLLGPALFGVYVSAFALAGVLKLALVVAWGRLGPSPGRFSDQAFENKVCDPGDVDCLNRSAWRLAQDAWRARKKMFIRMMTLMAAVTFAVQILMNTGALGWFETLIGPMTSLLGLPAAVVGPLAAYALSPTAGIAYMSNLLGGQGVTPYQAIFALMAGGLIMIPVTRLRRTLPRYISIFGFKNGSAICGLTMSLSMLSRVLVMAGVWLFFPR